MLEKIMPYFSGYLEIDIEGPNVEKFINLAIQNGIVLRDIMWFTKKKVRARAALKDRHILRRIARQSRCLFRIRKRKGMPFFCARVGKRKMLFAGGLIFCMIFYLFGNLILSVEVESPYVVDGQYLANVAKLAEDKGVKRGGLFFFLDFDQTENYLLWKIPDLIFADIKKEGTAVIINVVKRIDIEEEDRQKPSGNIIAKNDAVIEEIMVKKGTALVKKGDTVTAGQVLIAGVEGEQEVSAAGIVKARVWFKGYGEVQLVETNRQKTGNSEKQIFIAWKGKDQLLVSGPQNTSFDVFAEVEERLPLNVWRKITLPVEVVLKSYYQETESKHILDPEIATKRAGNLAKDAAMACVSPLSEIISTNIYPVSDAGGIIRVQAVIEAISDIGDFQPASDIPPVDSDGEE